MEYSHFILRYPFISIPDRREFGLDSTKYVFYYYKKWPYIAFRQSLKVYHRLEGFIYHVKKPHSKKIIFTKELNGLYPVAV